MRQIVVLGIGNRLLRDDGIGIYVVEELRDQDAMGNIRYVIGETDIDYCLDEIRDAEFIVIVDAARTGDNPGEVTAIPLYKATDVFTPGLSPHNLHPLDLIGYYNTDLNGILAGIGVCEIGFGLGLSRALEDKFPDILLEVQSIIYRNLY
jgi:hydrogenase maturation protease